MTLALNSLTPRARRVIVQAASEAEGQGQGFVGTEHLLLALARDSHGVAGQVLDQLGVREEVLVRAAATQGTRVTRRGLPLIRQQVRIIHCSCLLR
jgi:ATP-dependent Clp protease ATP-binding subunit ClpA